MYPSDMPLDDDVKSINGELSNKTDLLKSPLKLSDNTTNLPDPSVDNEIGISQPKTDVPGDKEPESINCAINFDQIFNPTKLGENIIPFLSYPESSNPSQKTTDKDCNFTGDFDLRLISSGSSLFRHPMESDSTTSSNDLSILSNCKRTYTFYDAHADDPEFELKRAKYFFNPRYPNNDANRSHTGYNVR